MTNDTPLTAAELILALMDSAANPELKSSYFVISGRLFNIDPRTMRVALTRLVKNAVLAQVDRGLYGLGPGGGELHSTVRNWVTVEGNLTRWDGGWIAVYVGHLRRDKAEVRQRERALRLMGFAPADANLWIRPANLKSTLSEVRERLLGLGLSTTAMVVALADLLPKNAIQIDQLWDISTLEQRYRTRIAELSESQRHAAKLTRHGLDQGVVANVESLSLEANAVAKDVHAASAQAVRGFSLRRQDHGITDLCTIGFVNENALRVERRVEVSEVLGRPVESFPFPGRVQLFPDICSQLGSLRRSIEATRRRALLLDLVENPIELVH